MSGEEILFETPNVKVTPARVVIDGATYAVANITSIKAVRDTSKRTFGICLAAVGVSMVVAAVLGVAVFTKTWPLGTIALGVGALLAWFGKSATLVLTTGAAEQVPLRSRNEGLVVEIASAINLAIMKRSAMR